MNDLQKQLLTIAIMRSRIVELVCAMGIFMFLGFLIAEKM